jgi:hypothetical protein
VGVCDVQGALILEAQGSADAQSYGSTTFINLSSGGVTVRVLSGSGATTGECLDVVPPAVGFTVFVTRAGGRLAGTIQPALSAGRCAGPLASDLLAVALPVRKTPGRHPSFDLRTSRSFAVGPFNTRLVSTLVLRRDLTQSILSGGSSSSGGGVPPPTRHKVLVEHVSLRYRVAVLPGSLQTSFSGVSDASCVIYNSCGTSGTLALSFAGSPGTLALSASRVVRRRVSGAQAIRDLRSGRLAGLFGQLGPSGQPVPFGPPLPFGPPAPLGPLGFGGGLQTDVSETFASQEGSRCQASSALSDTQVSFGGPPSAGRAGIPVTLHELGDLGVVRTYCPGPADSDVFGSQGRIAAGAISPTQLLSPHADISLSNPGNFSGLGYVGARGGAVGLSLSLVRIQAGTKDVIP